MSYVLALLNNTANGGYCEENSGYYNRQQYDCERVRKVVSSIFRKIGLQPYELS